MCTHIRRADRADELAADAKRAEGQNDCAVAKSGLRARDRNDPLLTHVRCMQVLRFLSAARSFLSTQARKQVSLLAIQR